MPYIMPISITGRLAMLNERHRLPDLFTQIRETGVITLTDWLDLTTVAPDARGAVLRGLAGWFALPADELADNTDLVDVKVTTEPFGGSPDLFTIAQVEFIIPADARPEAAS